MTIGQALPLHDGTAHAEIAKGPREAKHHIGERGHTEVCRREEAREEDANDELGNGAHHSAGEPPAGCACRSRRQALGHRWTMP